MIAFSPRISVVIVVGTLSSSTQMYSGSLAMSPKRGFLTSNHRVSAGLSATDGSLRGGIPISSRAALVTAVHPVKASVAARRHTTGRNFIRGLP